MVAMKKNKFPTIDTFSLDNQYKQQLLQQHTQWNLTSGVWGE